MSQLRCAQNSRLSLLNRCVRDALFPLTVIISWEAYWGTSFIDSGACARFGPSIIVDVHVAYRICSSNVGCWALDIYTCSISFSFFLLSLLIMQALVFCPLKFV